MLILRDILNVKKKIKSIQLLFQIKHLSSNRIASIGLTSVLNKDNIKSK